MTVPIWIGLWHLAWMAYRWGHALSRHTSVTQICLINRRTSTVKKNRSVLSKALSACRGVLFSIPLSNMVRIKLIKNVSKRNPLLYHTCIDRGGERKSGRSTAVLWGKCLEGRKTGACGGHYGRTKVKSSEFWKCRYLSVFRIPGIFFSVQITKQSI